MEKKTGLPIPPYFLFLDTLGTVLIGLGLAKQFGKIDIIPVVMRFENYAVFLIICGLILYLPAISHLVSKHKKQ